MPGFSCLIVGLTSSGIVGLTPSGTVSKYSVPFDQVHTSNKPSDCDWRRAPLGRKGCHYKATVQGFNAAGNLVAGEYAPKYGNDVRTGKPIVSSDGGKTWIWSLADAIPDRTVKTIRVEWVKVTE